MRRDHFVAARDLAGKGVAWLQHLLLEAEGRLGAAAVRDMGCRLSLAEGWALPLRSAITTQLVSQR